MLRAAIVLILCLFRGLTPPPAWAGQDTPLPFGFHLMPASTAPPAPASQTADSTVSVELARAQEQIAALRAAQGPYHPDLADRLLALADRAREYGFPTLAIELYSQGHHNLRINGGLNTQDQVPVLEELLALHRQAGDAAAVNDRETYLHRLAGSSRPPWDDQRLEAADRYLAWQLEWLLLVQGIEHGRAMLDYFDQATELAEEVCASAQWAPIWCARLSVRALGALYLIDYQIDGDFARGFGRRVSGRNDWDRSVTDDRLFSVEESAYATGVRLLEDALRVVPDDPDLRLALADWRWFQGRLSAAQDEYRELQRVLPGRFTRPAPLPELPAVLRDPRLARASALVSLDMEISSRGRVRQAEVRDSDELEDGMRSRARRALRETRFRPKLDASGEPVRSSLSLTLVVME